MTNKFPIGSQWRTRAGHRAVVVRHFVNDEGDNIVTVWLDTGNAVKNGTVGLYSNGHFFKDDMKNQFDLLTPWQEPRKGTVWVNIYDNGNVLVYLTKESADCYDVTRIACISADWTEGMGLEK